MILSLGLFAAPERRRSAKLVFAVYVVDHKACALFRHGQPVLALERALGVLVAALPVLVPRCAGEFVILGVALVGLLLIDQMQDRDVGQVRELFFQLLLFGRQLVLRDLHQRIAQSGLPVVDAAIDVGIVARARRIHDVL